MSWYQKTIQSVLEELTVKPDQGLTYDQAAARLKTFGPNLLAQAQKETLTDIFLRQFKSPLIYILILAAGLVTFLGQTIDALVIIAVITVNAIVGTIQEGKARNSLQRLKSLTTHKALVHRDGQEILVSTEEVVPGDILIIHEGDRVAADARIIKAESLKADESILTGEAYAVAKTEEIIHKENLVLGDQKNMLFAGTSVVAGYAEAVVVATGFDSEIGKISKSLLETAHVPLPLASKVESLTHFIAIAVLVIALAIFLVGILQKLPAREIFTAVIGLVVSIVPEGLPVAVTVVLAKGVWRMARAKAIVRQMAAVEAMGNADTLLVDKTGTITTGKMVIKKIRFAGQDFKVSGQGYEPIGKISGGTHAALTTLKKLLSLTYLSLKADVVREGDHWKPVGDSTEVAIAVACRKFSLDRDKLEKVYKTVVGKPFDSKKRYSEAVFSKGSQKWHVFVGAPEFLGRDLKIDHELASDYQSLAASGLRVIGVAVYGPKQNELFAHALLAIDEEIRPNVEKSIAQAQKAGFRIVMMTGDFTQTAQAIAQKIGIFEKNDKVLTGEDVERLSKYQLSEQLDKISVFARITPVHKLKIVNAFKQKGHIAAMTGDGVNDGPALQAANLGIGLGSGTQVAKDSSDIVLVDDNFSTIVAAIAEGRGIYLTLKKVILYLFSTSLGEVLVIATSVLIGLPLPLIAVQIIWLNFVTDGFFVVALAQDPPPPGLVSATELRSANLIDNPMITRILTMGATMLVVTLPIFYYFQNHYSLSHARSISLLILSAIQWLNALNVRRTKTSILATPVSDNWYLVGAFAAVGVLQFTAIQTNLGNALLHTTPLSALEWTIALLAASSIVLVEEIRKYFQRRSQTD